MADPVNGVTEETQPIEEDDCGQVTESEKTREWTPEEMNFLFKTFADIDANDDGTIVLDELRALLRNLGQNPTDEELRQIMRDADMNADQRLDFEEFCRLIDRQLKDQNTIRAELQAAFRVFDRDNSGTINFEELKTVLKSQGSSMTDAEISDLIGEVDVDGDGCVNFEEFVHLIMGDWWEQNVTSPEDPPENLPDENINQSYLSAS